MRKNPNVQPAKVNGNPSQGNGLPLAKMPANNVGTFPTKLGAGQKPSAFGHGTGPGKSSGGAKQSSKGGKANLPANNVNDKSVKLGHTKHGVGEVPSYLRGQ